MVARPAVRREASDSGAAERRGAVGRCVAPWRAMLISDGPAGGTGAPHHWPVLSLVIGGEAGPPGGGAMRAASPMDRLSVAHGGLALRRPRAPIRHLSSLTYVRSLFNFPSAWQRA